MFAILKKAYGHVRFVASGERARQIARKRLEQRAAQRDAEEQERERREEESRRRQEENRRLVEYYGRQAAVERREQERKEAAYQKFLKTNQVTHPDGTELDDNELRKQRIAAMRFAKDMQDSMPD